MPAVPGGHRPAGGAYRAPGPADRTASPAHCHACCFDMEAGEGVYAEAGGRVLPRHAKICEPPLTAREVADAAGIRPRSGQPGAHARAGEHVPGLGRPVRALRHEAQPDAARAPQAPLHARRPGRPGLRNPADGAEVISSPGRLRAPGLREIAAAPGRGGKIAFIRPEHRGPAGPSPRMLTAEEPHD